MSPRPSSTSQRTHVKSPPDQVTLTTDGACIGNPGPGGWAALLHYKKKEKLLSGSEPDTTNNRMELTAVIMGLEALKRRCHVNIVTDSQYVMKAFKEGWLRKWEANGWRTADKKPVKNQDLWETLAHLIDQHDIHWTWVKGHNGHPDNETVDTEARRQAERA
jgi:ribonuclease HI